MSKVSVIIPAFNAARYLAEAIDSILEQTYQDFEVIIANDGSTDDTLRVANRYPDPVRAITLQHCGPSAARNAAIQCSRGEYLAFLDADDAFLPAKLELQVAYLDAHPEVDIVYSNGYCYWEAGRGRRRLKAFDQLGLLHTDLGCAEESLPVLVVQNAFPIHSALVRRAVVHNIGGFDAELFGREDWDLWLRAAESHRFAYLDGYVALYRRSSQGVSFQFENQAHAVRVIGQKAESRNWFHHLPADVRSDFYLSWSVQELSYRQVQAAKELLNKSLQCNPGNLPARAALLAVQAVGYRAVEIYHLKQRLLGAPRTTAAA